MARGENLGKVATRDSRSKGGRARAEKLAAERQELAELRRGQLDVAVRRLAIAAERAAEVVEGLLDAKDEAVRLRAALGLLKTLDLAETAELATRLERLEASLNGGSR